MVQKVIKIGDSLGVTISKDKAQEMNIKAGDQVDILVRPVNSQVSDQEVIQSARGILKRSKQDFENLAKR